MSVPASCKVTRVKAHRTLDVAEAQRYVTGDVTAVNRFPGAGDRSLITDAIADGYGHVPDGWRDGLDLYGLCHVLELWTWFASLGERGQLGELADDLAARID